MPDHPRAVPYWRLSNFYFFYFATLGSFLPYWNLYLKHNGFNAAQIGELSALVMMTKILSPTLGGVVVDKTGKPLKIIRTATFFAAFLFSGFFFKDGFLWYAVITFGYSFFWNISLPQFEVATLFHLQTESHRYSQIRLWGSIGFIVAVLSLGHYLDHYPIDHLPMLVGALFTSIWLVSLCVPETPMTALKQQPIRLFEIIKQPEVMAFFTVYLLLHTAHAAYYAFYSIYLKQLHYSATLTGYLWVIGVVAEIVLFLLMRRLLKKVSLRRLLLTSIFLSGVRWLMIAFAAHSLLGLAGAQLLHAATFGLAHIVAIHLIHHYFGQQHQAKGQSLYTSLSFGVGGMLGSLFSGYYWDSLGAAFVFSSAAACCFVAFTITYRWIGRLPTG